MTVSLITSGHGLDDKTMETLVKYGVRVSISVDGPEQINDALRGKGAYQTALLAIQKTSKAGFWIVWLLLLLMLIQPITTLALMTWNTLSN